MIAISRLNWILVYSNYFISPLPCLTFSIRAPNKCKSVPASLWVTFMYRVHQLWLHSIQGFSHLSKDSATYSPGGFRYSEAKGRQVLLLWWAKGLIACYEPIRCGNSAFVPANSNLTHMQDWFPLFALLHSPQVTMNSGWIRISIVTAATLYEWRW